MRSICLSVSVRFFAYVRAETFAHWHDDFRPLVTFVTELLADRPSLLDARCWRRRTCVVDQTSSGSIERFWNFAGLSYIDSDASLMVDTAAAAASFAHVVSMETYIHGK